MYQPLHNQEDLYAFYNPTGHQTTSPAPFMVNDEYLLNEQTLSYAPLAGTVYKTDGMMPALDTTGAEAAAWWDQSCASPVSLDCSFSGFSSPVNEPSASPPMLDTPFVEPYFYAYPSATSAPLIQRRHSNDTDCCSSSSISSAAATPPPSTTLPVGFDQPTQQPLSAMDVRPYPCYLCTRAFARKHDLQRHIRVHTGAKPYACLCCKKAFARTDALKRHLRMEETCRTSPEIQAMKSAGKRRYRNL
ncbi:hypothetical protein BCR43DRAFT_488180 [Syncephalastrum racemosum]|uniref:C2H2-type domain-containing protein n=1 Tax=Syncephalastrum racemosum TaxID=13706 RepID=A0A1X2HI77_SYNRA|nr:hypothetical protein BCR43DRAFT_488180 [Syncephalastrum racemosum]